MKTEERHKCVVIPIVHSDGPIKILTVRDKRFKEWTFITGGCRKREISDPLKCAMRELDEETRGTFSISTGIYKYFKFKTKIRSPEELERDRRENIEVTCVYHVYIFSMNIPETRQRMILRKFEEEKDKMEIRKRNKQPIKKSNDENDYMSFDTFDDFMKKRIWEFINEQVIMHPEFEPILNTFFVNKKEKGKECPQTTEISST
tara:strand:+ start:566 stop:1177 length:612 start_codon:yes stop_codon:yes gene_type:complete